MILWLLRHAKAVPDPPKGGSDHERVLTPRGRRDADALGRRLAGDRLGLAPGDLPELVLCSTATRTVQTAERALAQLDGPPSVDHLRSLYGATPDQVLDALRAVDDRVHSVMVVGHNPTACDLSVAMDRSPDGRASFPTCAVAVFDLPCRRWAEVGEGEGRLRGLFAPPY